ncbi:MAG: hypothetical protein WBO24_07460 [Nitrospirales bacterium]
MIAEYSEVGIKVLTFIISHNEDREILHTRRGYPGNLRKHQSAGTISVVLKMAAHVTLRSELFARVRVGEVGGDDLGGLYPA